MNIYPLMFHPGNPARIGDGLVSVFEGDLLHIPFGAGAAASTASQMGFFHDGDLTSICRTRCCNAVRAEKRQAACTMPKTMKGIFLRNGANKKLGCSN
ncbi:MAG TPA: hypothetical protein VNW15_04320 [Rhizomicrobium sp.]|jgi:hypothetical protein|nr:hypothetical protein [Rhizomicrobium sp.]